MKDYTKYVADTGRGEPRFLGSIPYTPEAIRKLMKKLGTPKAIACML